MTQILAGYTILAATVSLSLWRPKLGPFRIHHSTAAVLGALLTVSLHILPVQIALSSLELLLHPLVTIVSLMLVTLLADQAGLFERLARSLAVRARGRGHRLFAYLFFTGSLTGSMFTNDAAVLIFTPLVYNLIEEVKAPSWTLKEKLPFYFSVLFVANIVGALVISNPINIVVSSLFGISFGQYALWMLLPALASVLVSYLGVYLYFRTDIPRTYVLRAVKQEPLSRFAIAALVVLALLLVGFFTETFTGIPVWMIAAGGAVVLLFAKAIFERVEPAPLVRGIGWDVLVFVCGIFIVARGLKELGLTEQLGASLSVFGDGLVAQSFSTGLFSAVASAFINNHPTADMMSWAIRDLSLPAFHTKILALSALIGGDLGPKMLPIGSLAALLWFGILRKKGVEIPYSLYVRIGVPVTLIALVCSLAVLNLQALLFFDR